MDQSQLDEIEKSFDESCGDDPNWGNIWELVEFAQHAISAKEQWPRPIPVSERLPQYGECVLVYFPSDDDCDFGMWDMAGRQKDKWCRWPESREITDTITHWLPMPPKPE